MAEKQRIDKWLWHARFFKTRTLCAKLVAGGGVRVDGVKIAKSSVDVAVGQTLTFYQNDDLRIIEVAGIGERRGPAPEAQALYVDHSPTPEKRERPPVNPKFDGKGRPGRKDRNAVKAFTKNSLE